MRLLVTRRRALSIRIGALVLTSALATGALGIGATPAYAQGKPSAQTPQARGAELFNKGAEAYRRGEFQQAATLLLEAYGLDPQPVLLYNLARAYEGLGNLDAAIDTYTRYLEADPKAPDRGAIEQKVGTLKRQRDERLALEKQRDAERARADEAKAKAERDRQAAPAPAPPPERSPSPFPYVVAGVGVAGLAAGAVFGLMATSKHDDAAAATTAQQSAIDQQNSAKSLATISTISFIAGGALVAAGVAWWVIDRRSSAKPSSGSTQSLRVGLAPGFIMLERGFP